jgi:hypothetical protein
VNFGTWLLGAISIKSTKAFPPKVLSIESIKILSKKMLKDIHKTPITITLGIGT